MMPPSYPERIHALTTLRGIAVAWVAVHGFAQFTGPAALADAAPVASGYLGVDFFFILSGFVLAHVHARQAGEEHFDYWTFITRRIARIYPMHLVTLAAFVLLGAATRVANVPLSPVAADVSFRGAEGAALFRGLVANLSLIHGWGSTSRLMFNLSSWSVSALWLPYLLFPVLLLLQAGRGKGAGLPPAFALFAGMAALLPLAFGAELTALTWNAGVLRALPEFLLGMALCRFGRRRTAGAGGANAGLLAAAALCVVLAMAARALPSLAPFLAAGIVAGLAGVIFFAADAERHGRLRLLRHPLGVKLGGLAYPFYMLHLGVGILLFDLAAPGLRSAAPMLATTAIAAALALTTLLAWIAHRLVERPAAAWIVRQAQTLNPHPSTGQEHHAL